MLLVAAAIAPVAEAPQSVSGLSATDLFAFAEHARERGDVAAAKQVLRALTHDPDREYRTEARFRLAGLLDADKHYSEAAVLYRAILDEQPDAQRVRLELARVLVKLGDTAGARRTLRQAQAGGLPRDVARLVDQFQNALRAVKPFGGSVEVALAPTTNINRATRATTLDTIIAPFELSKDARARSGIGVKLAGQGYVRLPVAKHVRWTLRASGQSYLYRQGQFNDVTGALETGVEIDRGRSRFQPLVGRTYRYYGGKRYAVTDVGSVNWLRSIGRRSQIDANFGVGRADYKLNDLQDGTIYDLGVAFEHAFGSGSGGRVGLSGQRQAARNGGYATTSGGGNLLYWREFGRTTLFGTVSVSHLEADARLFLFPKRRIEWQARASAGATLRQATVHGFAPVVRLSYERNTSTVGLYDYGRFGVEFGITRAF